MMFNFDASLQLGEFGAKIPHLLAKIDEFPDEKHYVYSAFYENRGSSQGILELARQLEKKGYVKLTVNDAKKLVSNNSIGSLPPAKRYILALNSEFGDGIQGPVNMDYCLQVYNNKANKSGALVHAFLASQTFNEGLNMKDVRHIHIFEPLVTMASDMQTIGRARRLCSHKNLDHSQWTVQIHRYFAELPINMQGQEQVIAALDELKATDVSALGKKELAAHKKEIKELEKLQQSEVKAIDEVIYLEAQRRMRDLFTVYRGMEEAAMDCVALQRFHSKTRTYKDFKCLT
jgi:hypothetical protein